MRKLFLLVLSLSVMPISHAADIATVSDAWVRLPPPGAQIAAAYLTLESKQPLRLTSITSTAVEAVEIHTMSMHKGMMEMRQLPELKLVPGKPVKLEPGGLHLMLINPKKPLKEGDKIPLVLQFKKGKRMAGTVNLEATVKAPAH